MRAIMMRTKNVVHSFTKKYNYIKKLVKRTTVVYSTTPVVLASKVHCWVRV